MKLLRFKSKKLNHTDDFDLKLEPDVTFLTGVNGSGKTAILRCVNALISPNLEALAALSYERIEVEFELSGERNSIFASRHDNEIRLGTSTAKKPFAFSKFEIETYRYPDPDSIKSYYQDLWSQANETDLVLKFISKIPTPMYLGLDRRHAGYVGRLRRNRPEPRIRKRNVFSSPLGDSLHQAVALAEDRFAAVRFQTSSFDTEFNRNLLLSLLEIPESDPFEIKPPTEKDRKLIENARKAIRSFPRVEGISADDIRAKIDPALTNIGEIVGRIPKGFRLADVKDDDVAAREALSEVLQWIRLKPLLLQVTKLADLINTYNSNVKKAREHLSQYTRLIDDFFGQTGKTLGFSPNGRIQIQHNDERFGVDELSSGEAQIFVILTHLSFNPHAKQAGVFIIDEPELSLHLFWQDMLVDNMLKANADIQYLMATHSPAIIGERVAKARELNGRP